VSSLLRLLRPAHWIKNLVCLAGVFFHQQWSSFPIAVAVAIAFILVSSAVYVLNDIVDVERDRTHPKKKHRPLAAGKISVTTAWGIAFALAISGIVLAFVMNRAAGCCTAAYLVINLAYSLKLKHLPIADAFCIAFGFILRLLAGLYVIDQLPSSWLALFTFFLSLFLGFAKRRAELVAMEDIAVADRRPVLDHYSLSFLDGTLDTSAAMAMVCYALFLLQPSSITGNPTQVVTVPLIAFMILHYRRRLTHPKYRVEPNRIIYHDRVMQGCALGWIIVYALIQHYQPRWFG
jgi:4-hydroxybenzoate polyprenyltransferase